MIEREGCRTAGNSSSILLGAFFAWKKFLYVFSVDKELSVVETWEGKVFVGGAKAVIPRSSTPGCFLKMNKIANVSRLFDFLQLLAPLLTIATSLQF